MPSNEVLEELGIEAKDTLLVLNKVDAGPIAGRFDSSSARSYPQACRSAPGGDRLDQLHTGRSVQTLSHNFLDVNVETGVADGRLLAQLGRLW